MVIEEILLAQLKEVTAYALDHEAEFVQTITKSYAKAVEKEIRDSHKEYEQAKSRISKLDTIVQRLYEDNIEGKISDERFSKMSVSYENEQKQLEICIAELQLIIDQTKEKTANVESFLKLV